MAGGSASGRRKLGSLHTQPARHHRADAGQLHLSRSATDTATRSSGTVTVTVLVEALPSRPVRRATTSPTRSPTSRSPSTCWPTTATRPAARRAFVGNPVCVNGGSAATTDDQRVDVHATGRGSGYVPMQVHRQKVPEGSTLEASIIVTVTAAPPGNRDPDGERVRDAARSQDRAVADTQRQHHRQRRRWRQPGVHLRQQARSRRQRTFTQKASTFVYTAPPTGSADHTPDVDSLTVTISDGHDGNVPTTISIRIIDDTVTPTAPLTHDIPVAATVGETTRLDVVAELRDANLGTTLTLVSAVPDSSTPEATVATSGGTSVVITPLAAGNLSITYVVENDTQATVVCKAQGRPSPRRRPSTHHRLQCLMSSPWPVEGSAASTCWPTISVSPTPATSLRCRWSTGRPRASAPSRCATGSSR